MGREDCIIYLQDFNVDTRENLEKETTGYLNKLVSFVKSEINKFKVGE